MTQLPHDVSDLALAPVILALDDRLEELGALNAQQLDSRVAFDANVDTSNPEQRESGALITIPDQLERHGWEVSLDSRGIRLEHGGHHVTLGLPTNLRDFLDQPSHEGDNQRS